MDQDIEKMYNVLAEENYPVSLPELKNPTSECMVKVMLTFLAGFAIDGKMILRATFGQLQSLSYPDVHQDLISLINLHRVMLTITDRIFVKDFYLTDITSPGGKKARRLIWTLVNFVLYSNNKMEELQESLNAITARVNTLNDILENKKKVMELRKQIVLENSKKAAHKERLLKPIADVDKRVEQKNKKIVALTEREQNSKLIKQEAQQKNMALKQQVSKQSVKINKMEASVVKSPEEYKARLDNYEQDYANKQKEVHATKEKLYHKRELVARYEEIQNFLRQEYQKLPELTEVHLKSKKLAKTQTEILKQSEKIQAVIQDLHKELDKLDKEGQSRAEKLDQVQAECEKQLAPVYELHEKLTSESQASAKKLEEAKSHWEQLRGEKDELSKNNKKLEEEIAEFLKQCQAVYSNEIREQVEIEKLWKSRVNIEDNNK